MPDKLSPHKTGRRCAGAANMCVNTDAQTAAPGLPFVRRFRASLGLVNRRDT